MKGRNNSEKIKAKIVDFKYEKVNLRNDFTKVYYPYVELENTKQIVKLSQGNSWFKEYKIGVEIYVFKNDNIYLDWNTYNKGIYKIFKLI